MAKHLLVSALLFATTTATAAPTMFRGTLEPRSFNQLSPVPISLTVDFVGTSIVGKVTTSAPVRGAGNVEGVREMSQCRMRAELGNGTTLQMRAYCDGPSLEGSYRIAFRDGTVWQGALRATRVAGGGTGSMPAAPAQTAPRTMAEPEAKQSVLPPKTRTECLGRKRACLMACPSGDVAAEQLCADRCARRFDACVK